MGKLSAKLEAKKFPSRDVTLCLDADLVRQREDASAALNRAIVSDQNDSRLRGSRAANEARERLADIERAMRESSVTIRFTGVPFGLYNKFVKDNPPRKGKQETFNAETFFMHVARRTGKLVGEDGTLEDIDEADWDNLEKVLTDAEHDRIASAIVQVNRVDGAKGIDFLSSNSSQTPVSGETSESPETTE